MTQPRHVMQLQETKPSGYECWYCDTCGRTLLICWQPWDARTLVEGDLDAIHTGGKGGVQIGVEVETFPSSDWVRDND